MNIYLEVYGCTANKGDASLILGVLKKSNYKIIKSIKKADILIILTCTVIETTEQRMLSRLRLFQNTGKKIIVAGCMASIQINLIKTILPDAKILPPQYSHHIIDLIEDNEVEFVEKNKTKFPKFFNSIVAPISISEGCILSCSYCITSLARGKLKSYPINEIIKDIYSSLKQGCKEIQLTAQDTSSYGLDINNNLGELLINITKINAKFRTRVGMMNPYFALKNINQIIKGYNNNKIYKFLHLPLQSGDEDILKKMNRRYTSNNFINIINKFRKKYPEITISTDIIVGFPSETDEQFNNTLSILKEIKPDIVNITRFSARPYTKAKDLKDRIPTDIVKKRSKFLTYICHNISEKNNKKYIGRKFNILITEKGKNNTIMGRTENYKPVILTEKIKLGEFIDITIKDAKSTYLVGRLI
jgi:MiaB-like tRNA modifying enzyme